MSYKLNDVVVLVALTSAASIVLYPAIGSDPQGSGACWVDGTGVCMATVNCVPCGPNPNDYILDAGKPEVKPPAPGGSGRTGVTTEVADLETCFYTAPCRETWTLCSGSPRRWRVVNPPNNTLVSVAGQVDISYIDMASEPCTRPADDGDLGGPDDPPIRPGGDGDPIQP